MGDFDLAATMWMEIVMYMHLESGHHVWECRVTGSNHCGWDSHRNCAMHHCVIERYLNRHAENPVSEHPESST